MSEKLWIEKGKTYREEFRKKTRIQRLRYLIQEWEITGALGRIRRESLLSGFEVGNILDAGCGFGRITRILCRFFPFASIGGGDISEDQLKEAMDDLPRVGFFNWNVCDPWILGEVELVTAIELLMHITPERIESAIENICHASVEFVLTVDWWTLDQVDIWAGKTAGFCYLHNYGKLFSDAGFYRLIEKKIPFVDQKLRIYRRRTDE